MKGLIFKFNGDVSKKLRHGAGVMLTVNDSVDRKVGVVCDIRNRDPDGRLGKTSKLGRHSEIRWLGLATHGNWRLQS